ncbi:hypothetical protein [Pseudomonas japonica]|uniref:Uncharacterized protein n=1 Tax=Pseudomonas japonica TaxID=256466 RepID=A0A239A606_9PSED|nr:hypothetical protein [Pseudomonas japonica]SNR90990.1 hypothetical protein SAMN05444352_101212 [Pseudomonas japonica]
MSDPFDKATAHPPPTLGEGCLSRYDPSALGSEDGTDFPGAAELWKTLAASGDALKQGSAEQVEVVGHNPPDPHRRRG